MGIDGRFCPCERRDGRSRGLLRHVLHMLRDGEVAEAEEAAGVFAEELRLLFFGEERALDDEVVGHLVGDGRDGLHGFGLRLFRPAQQETAPAGEPVKCAPFVGRVNN